jgi:hypothetical protein
MYNLHPYEYLCFSPLIGGVPGANGRYEMDYWDSSEKLASLWLARNYRDFTRSSHPTIQDSPFTFQYMTFLPENFQTVERNPEFIIAAGPFTNTSPPTFYRLIHTESIEGVPLCRIYVHLPSTSN